MERDYENRQRQQSRIVINDYPSSHLPQPQRPKFWGDTSKPAEILPQRALSYVERPCVLRETTAPDKVEPSQDGLLTTSEKTRPQSAGGYIKCRQDAAGSGISPAHCSPCYVSSTLSAGDRTRTNSAPAPETSSEVVQLSAWLTKHLETAAKTGCGSVFTPPTTVIPVSSASFDVWDVIDLVT